MTENLRPTSYTFSGGGTNDNPAYAYDADIFTYNHLGVSNNNCDPTIIYHTWATPAESHSKRTLYIRRRGTGNSNDNWGVYYSIDGGSNWTAIETGLINPSAEWCPPVDIDKNLDLSNLQVKIATAKVAGPDNGYADIYDVMLEGQLTGSTETLRPNAAGDECNIPYEAGAHCPNHYQNVDEAIADEDTTYQASFAPEDGGGYRRDLYGIPSHSVGSGTINHVTVNARLKGEATPERASAKICIKSDSTITEEEKTVTSSWVDYSKQWAVNPADSQAWEWADIDALQIGIALRYCCELEEEELAETLCTQVYVEVDYTPGTAYYHGLKVQGVGELALCDVGTNPLRIRKGGTTYGIELVETSDPNASPVRIKTGVGVKAIRKYT